jgi:hypothetical protein
VAVESWCELEFCYPCNLHSCLLLLSLLFLLTLTSLCNLHLCLMLPGINLSWVMKPPFSRKVCFSVDPFLPNTLTVHFSKISGLFSWSFSWQLSFFLAKSVSYYFSLWLHLYSTQIALIKICNHCICNMQLILVVHCGFSNFIRFVAQY